MLLRTPSYARVVTAITLSLKERAIHKKEELCTVSKKRVAHSSDCCQHLLNSPSLEALGLPGVT
jgi:hypothetical protein